MRVGQTGNNPVQSSEAANVKGGGKTGAVHVSKSSDKASAATEKGAAPQGAKAEISSKSKEFAQARASAASAPDVREDRVAELKQRIAEGSYKIDGESIADRLVDDHLRMSGIG